MLTSMMNWNKRKTQTMIIKMYISKSNKYVILAYKKLTEYFLSIVKLQERTLNNGSLEQPE